MEIGPVVWEISGGALWAPPPPAGRVTNQTPAGRGLMELNHHVCQPSSAVADMSLAVFYRWRHQTWRAVRTYSTCTWRRSHWAGMWTSTVWLAAPLDSQVPSNGKAKKRYKAARFYGTGDDVPVGGLSGKHYFLCEIVKSSLPAYNWKCTVIFNTLQNRSGKFLP